MHGQLIAVNQMEPLLENLVNEWLRLDEERVTREEIMRLYASNDVKELELRLIGRIVFGTAGLRARMEAGFTRMNSLTVIQASQGLAEYMLSCNTGHKRPEIVIGYDHRHNSSRFAELAATAFAQKNIKVYLLARMIHTPLVPFIVRHIGAAAGVMITASHNPKDDNGYKVYWSNGCQIIPPHDKGIAAAIDRNITPVSWNAYRREDFTEAADFLKSMEEKYYCAVMKEALSRWPGPEIFDSPADVVYTPMHGTGLLPMANIFLRLAGDDTTNPRNHADVDLSGIVHMNVVAEQAQPDPSFPTVPKPNPEEHGALDIALLKVSRSNKSLVFVTDPDADRFAVAAETDSVGVYRQLTGDQVGILFAAHIIEHSAKTEKPRALLNSVVSSRMLKKMAEHNGFHYEETLTGFKWLGNRALELMAQGYDVPFAYEEALGYMFPESGIIDKDGVLAAAVFSVAAQRWLPSTVGHSHFNPWTKLRDLYQIYGYFSSANTYVTSPSQETTAEVFAWLRRAAGHLKSIQDLTTPEGKSIAFPTSAGPEVLFYRDMASAMQYDRGKMHRNNLMDQSNMLTFEFEHAQFTIRSSGTEPKIKLYVEAWQTSSMDDVEHIANALQQYVLFTLMDIQKFGLVQA